MSEPGRPERAVAQSLGFAPEAATGDFIDVIAWMRVERR
jgi:hypothetical protein